MIVLKDHTIKAFGDIDELTEDVETFMDWIITDDIPSDVLERFIRIFKILTLEFRIEYRYRIKEKIGSRAYSNLELWVWVDSVVTTAP